MYVALVINANSAAYSYANSQYNYIAWPTTYYDGGYRLLVGGYPQTAYYTSRIAASGSRAAHDIYLEVSLHMADTNEYLVDYIITSNELTNDAPAIPAIPQGEHFMQIDEVHTFSTSTIEPDGDEVFYRWVFADGDSTDWLGPYSSSQPCEVSHSWAVAGDYNVSVMAKDKFEAASSWSEVLKVKVIDFTCGDADGNEIVNISDAVYLISYIFAGGPAPDPLLSGDADCNEIINISDAVYLISYVFGGGPAPCESC